MKFDEQWFLERNLFKKPEELPPAGEYESWFIGTLPAPEGWHDKSSCRFCFLIRYDAREYAPAFMAKMKPTSGQLTIQLYSLLTGVTKIPPEVNWSLLRGKRVRITIERATAKLTGKSYPKVVNVRPLH